MSVGLGRFRWTRATGLADTPRSFAAARPCVGCGLGFPQETVVWTWGWVPSLVWFVPSFQVVDDR